MGAVKTERKVVRLCHVAEYCWLPGLRHEGDERGKGRAEVSTRRVAGDSSHGRAGKAQIGHLLGGT